MFLTAHSRLVVQRILLSESSEQDGPNEREHRKHRQQVQPQGDIHVTRSLVIEAESIAENVSEQKREACCDARCLACGGAAILQAPEMSIQFAQHFVS